MEPSLSLMIQLFCFTNLPILLSDGFSIYVDYNKLYLYQFHYFFLLANFKMKLILFKKNNKSKHSLSAVMEVRKKLIIW